MSESPGTGAVSARAGRGSWIVGEIAVATLASLAMALAGRGVAVDPLERVGQVSGLAQVQFRFAVVGVVLLGCVRWCTRPGTRFAIHRVERIACAALAGLGSGLFAAGLCVALGGTAMPLFAGAGDTGRIVSWIDSVRAGHGLPQFYPPLSIYALASAARLLQTDSAHAYQLAQIFGTALFGPLGYLAWRVRLAPMRALVTSVVASAPLIDPYKPATNVTLVVLLPLLIAFFERAAAASERSVRERIVLGASFGLALGLLFDNYIGWFYWCAPAAVVSLGVALRGGRIAALAPYFGSAAALFAVVTGPVVLDAVAEASRGKPDGYFHFDVYTQPAFMAMYLGDLPGQPGVWPPHGELGGVGLFTLALCVGIAAALALGLSRQGLGASVRTLGTVFVSAWLMRMHLAGAMYRTKLVQMYPRTTPLLLHCALLLVTLAVWASLDALRDARTEGLRRWAPPRRDRLFGAIGGMLFLLASVGGAQADRFMPNPDKATVGHQAYRAHYVRIAPGAECSRHVPREQCWDPPARRKAPPRR